jgi:enoyl-CoA hydratase/carnithine racemase
MLKKEDRVATLTLNRPEKFNTIKMPETLYDIRRAIDEISNDDEIRVLVVTGAGNTFCIGGDIEGFDDILKLGTEDLRKLIWLAHKVVFEFRRLEKPTIASVNGDAVGGGASLAINCDIILASTNARFGWVFPRIGLSSSDWGATYLLPRIVGLTKAFELLYTGKVISASEAERIGLVNSVVSLEQLGEETEKWAKTIANGPPVALALTKLAICRGLSTDYYSDLGFESHVQTLCLQTEDINEGVKAFLEKRRPSFKGK